MKDTGRMGIPMDMEDESMQMEMCSLVIGSTILSKGMANIKM